MNDSMINPSIVDLLEKVDNRYSLVVATSRRARQLIDGAEPTIDEKGRKPLTIAIDEVEEGNIQVKEGSDKVVASPDISELEEMLSEHDEDIVEEHINPEAEEGLE